MFKNQNLFWIQIQNRYQNENLIWYKNNTVLVANLVINKFICSALTAK